VIHDSLSFRFLSADDMGDVLITYSTHSLSELHSESIKTQKPVSKKQSGPSNLRVTDPYQRVFFFSIEQCKTWFVSINSPLFLLLAIAFDLVPTMDSLAIELAVFGGLDNFLCSACLDRVINSVVGSRLRF
jgi:hypothetical protein